MATANTAIYTSGSTLRHLLVLSSTSTIGLLARFIVDLVDMYFLSLLGHAELAAAVGFAGTIMFFLTAMAIGLQIGISALVARNEGSNQRTLAQNYCGSGLLYSFILTALLSIVIWLYIEELLAFLGARGATLAFAVQYAKSLLPSSAFLAMGMCAAAVLRSIGDAKYSMYATLGGGIVNALLDPLFIFTFEWGIEGAAAASVVARLCILIIAFHSLIYRHRYLKRLKFSRLKEDISAINKVAMPAMLTNLATPIGSSFVMKTMASFGDEAVAASAILGRIIPVAFAGLFSLSGAIGPVIGQNAGAKLYGRVRKAILNTLLINFVYCLMIWVALWMSRDLIISIFSATGLTASLIDFYCSWLVGLFIFTGLLFTANAGFNNLNKAKYATAFNFCRVLLGTVPLVYLMAQNYGAYGVFAGELLGAVLWGVLAYTLLLWKVKKLEQAERVEADQPFADLAQMESEGSLACQNGLSSAQCQLGLHCENYSKDKQL